MSHVVNLRRADVADQRFDVLGIPDAELTPAVRIAAAALMEKIASMNSELQRTREHLHELEQLVDVDVLTPIPNRRAFMHRLKWALAMFHRYGHPCSVLFFDMNGLKTINDTYGHAAGDAAIKHVAHLIAANVRDSDFVARLGGDEFAVIMYHASITDAMKRGETIASKVAETPLVWNEQHMPTSIAFGTYEVTTGDTPESALSSADTAMYLNKRRMKAETATAASLYV